MELIQDQDLYSLDFESVRKTLSGEPEWFKELRRSGMEHFAAEGFPALSEEAWRFTSFRELARTSFEPAADQNVEFDQSDLAGLEFSDLNCNRIVFVNGSYRSDLSDTIDVPGLTVTNLEAALMNSPEAVEAHLGRYADLGRNPFVALNTALSRDGFFLYLNSGTRLQQPIPHRACHDGLGGSHPKPHPKSGGDRGQL